MSCSKPNMKRYPQCSRVETDNTLVFCRVDGTALISDSGSVVAGCAYAKNGSKQEAENVINKFKLPRQSM